MPYFPFRVSMFTYLSAFLISGIAMATTFDACAQGSPAVYASSPDEQEQSQQTGAVTLDVVVEGRDFIKLQTPLRVTPGPPNQVEVAYFFWYGSPWSLEIDAQLRQWANNRPYPMRFSVTPVTFEPTYGPVGVRIFYALEFLQEERRVGPLFLQALHRQQVSMSNPQSVLDWMAVHGIAPHRFQAALNHTQVRSAAASVPLVMRQYQITSVPSVVIDGQYLIRADQNTSPQRFLAIVQLMADRLSEGGPRP